MFRCLCGEKFPTYRLRCEHIAIQNPRWPRTSPDDQHGIPPADLLAQAYANALNSLAGR